MVLSIKLYCDALVKDFDTIPDSRKKLLEKITKYIDTKRYENMPVNLVYICTHNSRRSHFGQIWAHVASRYYNIPDIHTFSGGTEATAFNINAINALKRIGFDSLAATTNNNNPIFHIIFDTIEKPILCFSKVYNNPANPQKEFAAIMTCSDAEKNCPFIPGAEWRIGTTYDDPKTFDNTPFQNDKYNECCRQIALETFYVFSKIQTTNK
jgi:arsenate reductase